MRIPGAGTKDRLKFDLLRRPNGATLDEINSAVGHNAWSYINDTKRLAKRCGGIPHWSGDGNQRRFWITVPLDETTPPAARNLSRRKEMIMVDGSMVANGENGSHPTNLLDRIRADISSSSYYAQNFSNDGQRFLAWYLRNCYLRTPIQAHDDITDGPNDKEIDAVIVDEEKRQVIIIQSKFFGGSVDHAPLHEVLAAWFRIQDIASLQQNCNTKLKVKLEAVAEALAEDYEVVFELVTTGNLTEAAKNDLQAFQSKIADFEHPDASLSLVDSESIQIRWDEAVGRELPKLAHEVVLEEGKYLVVEIDNYKTVLAAVPLTECLKFPGIVDGKLFRPNVRQSLGLTNKINKGMKQTLNGENPEHFFFYHNGITALCEKLSFDPLSKRIALQGLGVVNGCQSLTTILSCSQRVKSHPDARVLVRFYEIPQRELADKISIYTNSQSAVKPRDLRSNDKRILALKKAYENAFPTGYLITKRGEERPADRDEAKTIDISLLAKYLMAWHCQRPNISHNDNQLFDKHFEVLFKSSYRPADIAALNFWGLALSARWSTGDLQLNEALMAYSWSKFHLLYAIELFFSTASKVDKVPVPSETIDYLDPDSLISFAASCYNLCLRSRNERA
jgi:AIPR protein